MYKRGYTLEFQMGSRELSFALAGVDPGIFKGGRGVVFYNFSRCNVSNTETYVYSLQLKIIIYYYW